MDPNVNLQEQERLLAVYRSQDFRAASGYSMRQPVAQRLSELRTALREWLARGGFEPDWTTAPKARVYYGR